MKICSNCGYELNESGKRTLSQNASIRLFCKWISVIYNDAGYTFTNVFGFESIWTPNLVYETIWRVHQIQLYGKISSTQLLKNEVSLIADTIIDNLAMQGYSLEFPSMQLFLNHIDKYNYETNYH